MVPLGISASAHGGQASAAGDTVVFRATSRATDRAVLVRPTGSVETLDTLRDPTAPRVLRWKVELEQGVLRLVPTVDGGVDVMRIAAPPTTRSKSDWRKNAGSGGGNTRSRRPTGHRRATAPPHTRIPTTATGSAPPHAFRTCSPMANGGSNLLLAAGTRDLDQSSWLVARACAADQLRPSGIETRVVASPRGPPQQPTDTTPRIPRGNQDSSDPTQRLVARIAPPRSADAHGRSVPTTLTVEGDVLTMHVSAPSDADAYPVIADPEIVGENDRQPCSSLVQTGTFQGQGVLTRGCHVWFAIGFNDYRLMNYAAGLPHPFANSTSKNQGCGPILDSEDQAYELDRIAETGANVVRIWFFQKYFQDFRDDPASTGHDPWTPYVHLLQAAKARGLLVIPVVVNHWSQCDREPSSGTSSPANDGKHADYSFYGPGPGGATPTYKVPGTFGYTYSAKQWASKVAAEFGPNGSHSDLTSTIAYYQLVNEAEVDASTTSGAVCGPNGAQSLYHFGQDLAATIKAEYVGHTAPLVSLGTMAIGQCGVSSSVPNPLGAPNDSDFAVIHSAPGIDLCEVHDYDAESISDLSFDWYALPYNNLAQRLKECGSKPLVIGEAGIEANVQNGNITRINGGNPSPPAVTATTLARRAQYLSNKIATSLNAGVSGYVLWDKIMAGADSAWNKKNDETLGFGAYGVRTSGTRHQDPSLCVLRTLASDDWNLGAAPPDAPSQASCDSSIPVPAPADHYAFVDGTTEGWSTENAWGDLTLSTVTGNAPSVHPASDPANHALKLTIHSEYTPAVEVESDSVALLQPGDEISMWVRRASGSANVGVSPLLRLGDGWEPCPGTEVRMPSDGSWRKITMTIPSSTSGLGCLGGGTPSDLTVHAVGLWVQDDNPYGSGSGQSVYLDDVTW